MAGRQELLLHLCCAPCGTVGWSTLASEGLDVTGFFYGANIHPQKEWRLRQEATALLAQAMNRPVIAAPWEPRRWLEAVAPWRDEPECGRRCQLCFELQLEAAAQAAVQRGITRLCTSLTNSRQKDPQLINGIGAAVAHRWGLQWEERIWRKNNGVARSVQMAKELGLYRQNYCGCMYSMGLRVAKGIQEP